MTAPIEKRTLRGRIGSAVEAFFGHAPLKTWEKNHPVAYKRVTARLSTSKFTGLPLTLIVTALLVVVITALGIAQDYLAHDPMVAADTRIANLLYTLRSMHLLSFFYGITLFGEAAIALVGAVLLSVVLWCRRQRILAIGVWLALIPSEGMTYLGKIFFHRDRPSFRAIAEDSFSFPSGHATTVVAFYGFLAYLFLRKVKTWKARCAIVLGLALCITLVDLSRMYLGVHYLSDVLAGNLVGLAGVLFAVGVIEWVSEKRFAIDWKHFSLVYVLPSIGCIVIVVAALFFKAPDFTAHNERPIPRTLPSTDVLPLFTEEGLPKYSETLLGTTQEPVNIIIVGQEQCLVDGFGGAGWLLADVPSWSSLRRVAFAALGNTRYTTAPMTPSFFNAFPHDYGFEKETAEQTARQRHHARFWDTGYVSPQGEVYVGTASLDVGIKWGITHRIAPDIDTERNLLVADLQDAGVVADMHVVPFVPPVLGANFSGDPFFTDGEASILVLSDCE